MIRVVTYNVSGGVDTGAVATVLTTLAPTLVCLQELPGPGRLLRLSRALGLEVVVRAGRRGTGTAVLARPDVRVLDTARLTLPASPDAPRRHASAVEVETGGLALHVLSVQLSLHPEARARDTRVVAAALADGDAPPVVGADLNSPAEALGRTPLAERLQDAHVAGGTGAGHTYPTIAPSTRQDVVLVDRTLRVLGAFVPDRPPVDVASHHLPVVADLAGRDDEATRLPVDDEDDVPDADASRRIA